MISCFFVLFVFFVLSLFLFSTILREFLVSLLVFCLVIIFVCFRCSCLFLIYLVSCCLAPGRLSQDTVRKLLDFSDFPFLSFFVFFLFVRCRAALFREIYTGHRWEITSFFFLSFLVSFFFVFLCWVSCCLAPGTLHWTLLGNYFIFFLFFFSCLFVFDLFVVLVVSLCFFCIFRI